MVEMIAEFATGVGAGGYTIMYTIVLQLIQFGTSSGNPDNTSNIIETIYQYTAAIGIAFALAFCLMEILEKAFQSGQGNMTVQQIVLPLVKFAVVYGIIYYGFELIGFVLSGSNAFAAYINQNLAVENVSASDPISASGLLANIFLVLIPAIISMFFQIIAAVLICVQVISIKLEIVMQAIFLPVAAANMLNSGPNGGSGMRYIKRFLGNIFMLGMILVMIYLVFAIVADANLSTSVDSWNSAFGDIVGTLFLWVFTAVVGPFACVGAISSVKSVVSSAFQ